MAFDDERDPADRIDGSPWTAGRAAEPREEVVRATLDAVAAPALLVAEGRVVHANVEAEAVFGAGAGQLRGRAVDGLLATRSGSVALVPGAPAVAELMSGEEVVVEVRPVSASLVVLTLRESTSRAVLADAHAAQQMIRLQAVTSLLSRALTEAEVAAVVVRYAVEATGSDTGGVLYTMSADGTALELAAQHGAPEHVMKKLARLPLDAPMPASYAASTREAVWVETAADYDAMYPELAAILRPATRAQALCVLPLVASDRLLGVLGMGFTRPHPFAPSERAFIRTLVEQCSQALDRAAAYERERRARAEAELARRSREELLAVVAHDLKNPLGMVVLAASALERRAAGTPLGEAVRRSAQHILYATDRMERLTRDLLDAASIEAGRLHLTPRAGVDVGVLVDEALAVQAPHAEAKEITLHRDVAVGALAYADRDRIAQVLANLASNAVKFTPMGGEVRLTVTAEGEAVRVQVADSGAGIGAEGLARLFDRFARGDHAGSETGLGLYIAKGIVEAHGGALDVRTEVGRGTVFSFSLRCAS